MTRLARYALWALAMVLMVPAVVGMIDAWCWTMFGQQATGIDWADGRAVVAYVLTIAGLPLAVSLWATARG